jgi:hypothetical protein
MLARILYESFYKNLYIYYNKPYAICMKKISLVALTILSISIYAQEGYWQQKVEYVIDATLDDKKGTLMT